MTLFSYHSRSSTELPVYIEEISANYPYNKLNKIGTPGGIPTHAKLRLTEDRLLL